MGGGGDSGEGDRGSSVYRVDGTTGELTGATLGGREERVGGGQRESAVMWWCTGTHTCNWPGAVVTLIARGSHQCVG